MLVDREEVLAEAGQETSVVVIDDSVGPLSELHVVALPANIWLVQVTEVGSQCLKGGGRVHQEEDDREDVETGPGPSGLIQATVADAVCVAALD